MFSNGPPWINHQASQLTTIIEHFEIKVQFSCSAVSDSLWPHGHQHTRLSCPSPTPGACSNSCQSSRWCHPTISSSVIPSLLLLPSIFPSIRVFSDESVLHIRWPKYSALASVLPMNIQELFLLRLTCLIFLHSKELSREFPITQFKSINSLALSFLYGPTLVSIHDYWKHYSFD